MAICVDYAVVMDDMVRGDEVSLQLGGVSVVSRQCSAANLCAMNIAKFFFWMQINTLYRIHICVPAFDRP